MMRVTKAWTCRAEKALWSWTTEMMVSSGFPNMKTTSSNASRYVCAPGAFLCKIFYVPGSCPFHTRGKRSHALSFFQVYELVESRWVDQGTALCFGQYEDGEAALVAKAEANMSEIILKTTIRSSDVYQRQQG